MKLKRPISLGWRAAYVVCAVLCVSADQLTKRIIEQKLPLYSRVRLFGPVSLTHLRNSGAAFGLFQGSSLLLAVIGFAVLGAAVAIWGIGFGSTKMRWGLVFLASGSVGNLIDRLVRGAVVDFVDLGFWPVFNLADVLIVTGVLLALCAALFDKDVLDQPAGLYDNKAE
ncbi:MAG: signal peptidase II [Bacillota bacterium]|mgnify:FL=1|jgi:signal peptidase II|nr:signal peptidase II [Bacillota bacterium]HOB91093.1 signal peptidase II [Bacillota bacterium]HPZ54219.1 signal peptidase II [Bacillota bacterium]HQD18314.1 signal peptidase II [Bacillota bacterium]